MTTISSLASAAALSGTEPLPIDQSGATVKATVNQVKTYVNTTPAITGGSINSTPIGATTPSTGAFTSLSASGLAVTVATGAASALITATTGTESAYIVYTNTGGSYYVGIENSTGGSFSSTPYALVQYAPVGRTIQTNINSNIITSVSSSGLAVTGNISSTGRTLVGTTTDDGVNALQVNGSVKATGINSTPIGATAPSTGAFTSLSASSNTVLTSTGTTLTLNRPNAAFCMQFNGGGLSGSLVGASAADTFTVGKASNGATMMELSASGLAVTGNTSTTGRALVGTTTDDGVNALQVNGTIAVGKGRIVPVTATTGITTTPTAIYTVGSQYCSILKVFITDSASHSALDVIAVGSGGGAVTVMTSANLVGVSPVRGYTISAGIVKVSVASTTCNTRVIADEFI